MKEFIVKESGNIDYPESYGNSRESFIYGEKQRAECSEIFLLTKKLNEVNMKLAQLGMSMESSELKNTQQYKDLISIVEYIGMEFKTTE